MPTKTIYTIESEDLRTNKIDFNKQLFNGNSFSGNEANCAFLNKGGRQFTTASHVLGFDYKDDGRAIAMVDWDHDGDLDLWLTNRTGPQVRYLENQLATSTWSSLKLNGDGIKVNRDAVGSTVIFWIKDSSTPDPNKLIPIKRTVTAGSTFLSQSSLRITTGLGSSSQLESIEIRWPDGKKQILKDVQTNQHYVLNYTEEKAKLWKRAVTPVLPNQCLNEPVLDSPRLLPLVVSPLPPTKLLQQDGKHSSFKNLAKGNKVTWIKFWVGWCDQCKQELDLLPVKLEKLKQHGISPILINADFKTYKDTLTRLKHVTSPVKGVPNLFIEQNDMELIQYYLDSIQVQQQPITMPFSVLLNDKGYAVAIYYGPVTLEALLQGAKSSTLNITQRYHQSIPFAGKLYDKVIRSNIDHLAFNFHSIGKLDYAKKLYAIGNPFHQNAPEYLANQQLCEVDLGNHAAALPKLLKILPKMTNLSRKYVVQKNIGDCYFITGDNKNSLKAYIAATKLDKDYKLLANIAIVYSVLKNFEKSETFYLQAIDMNRKSKELDHLLWRGLFKLYEDNGKAKKMHELLEKGHDLGVLFSEAAPAFEF